MMRRLNPGNTIAEYVLIGGLVSLTVFALFSILGQGMDTSMQAVKAGMTSKSQKAEARSDMVKSLQADRQSQNGGLLNTTSWRGVELGTGQTITTGSNGNQQVYGNSANAGGSPAAVDAPPGTAKALVKDVANKAHEIAVLQGILDELATYSNGNMSAFAGSSAIAYGKLMTAQDIARTLGNEGLTSELQKTTEKLLNSSANENLKQTVSQISDKVQQNASESSDKSNDVFLGVSSPAVVSQVTDAGETDKDAAKICEAGGGADTGKRCVIKP
jgi:hypothetical protein